LFSAHFQQEFFNASFLSSNSDLFLQQKVGNSNNSSATATSAATTAQPHEQERSSCSPLGRDSSIL
jgi:hypothetical protein